MLLTGAPADSFYGNGLLGQRVIVAPDQDLVIVRLGLNLNNDFDPVRAFLAGGAGLCMHCIVGMQPMQQQQHVDWVLHCVQVYGYDFFTQISAALPKSSPAADVLAGVRGSLGKR
jgi:hypothetical protein